MPVMENTSQELECVVCPVLAKKAKKKLKEQQRLAEENDRKAREIRAAEEAKKRQQALDDEERMKRILQAQAEEERIAKLQEEEERLLQEAQQHELASLKKAEEARIAALEAKEAKLLDEARRAAALVEDTSMAPTTATAYTTAELELQKRQELRRLEEERLRLSALELSSAEESTVAESMRRDLMMQTERQQLVSKSRLEQEIRKLETERRLQEDAIRRIEEDKRMEEEDRMLRMLEEEAAEKERAAEEAIAKAKAALNQVSNTRKGMIAQTIALAEREAVAEAEEFLKSVREDYVAPVILPSKSEVKAERWETLRSEGRAVMTRRVMSGWTILSEYCLGTECHNSPLIAKGGIKECVVCGGCGQGDDGIYATKSMDEDENELDDGNGAVEVIESKKVFDENTVAEQTLAEINEDFESKRNMVSKEIGRRMLDGWTLMDASCPKCVMPLMMDNKGTPDICILCGMTPKQAPIIEKPAVEAPVKEEDGEPTATHSDEESATHMDYSTIATIQSAKSEESFKPKLSVHVDASEEVEDEEHVALASTKSEDSTLAENIRMQAAKSSPRATMGDPPEMDTKEAPEPDEEKTDKAEADSSADEAVAKEEVPDIREEAWTIFSSSHRGLEARQLVEIEKTVAAFELAQEFVKEKFPGITDEERTTMAAEFVENIKDAVSKVSVPASAQESSSTENSGPESENASLGSRPRVTPETMGANRSRSKNRRSRSSSGRSESPYEYSDADIRPRAGLPPPSPNRRRPPTYYRRSSPRSDRVVVVGGPGDDNQHFSDEASFGAASRASSVASETLDSILCRIEECKEVLLDPETNSEKQSETAALIEKLAAAAVAMKKLEDMDF